MTAWTPDAPPPAVAWSRDPSPAAAWGPGPPPYADWSVQRSGSTRRITQDGRRRITEQGNVRILERFAIRWTIAPLTFNPWS